MAQWYYIEDDEKKGPFSFDELLEKDISNDTLVWKNGMSHWELAKNVDDLKNIFNQAPPLTPKETKELKIRKLKLLLDGGIGLILVLLILIDSIVVITLGYDEYGKALFNNGIYLVLIAITFFSAYIFWRLKKHLNIFLKLYSENKIINNIIGLTFLSLIASLVIKTNGDEIVQHRKVLQNSIIVLFLYNGLIMTHAISILEITTSSSLLKSYAIAFIILISIKILILVLLFFNIEDDFFYYTIEVLASIPFFILSLLFFQTAKNLKNNQQIR